MIPLRIFLQIILSSLVRNSYCINAFEHTCKAHHSFIHSFIQSTHRTVGRRFSSRVGCPSRYSARRLKLSTVKGNPFFHDKSALFGFWSTSRWSQIVDWISTITCRILALYDIHSALIQISGLIHLYMYLVCIYGTFEGTVRFQIVFSTVLQVSFFVEKN